MKELKDFADEINKCSKCGLCQSVCPVYKITGNDCAVSKGKFIMLEGVLKGDLKLNKNIEKYLDMCMRCGKCKDFCPSSIDVCEIFNTAKHQYAKDTFQRKFEKFLQSKAVFGNLIKFFKIFHYFNNKKKLSQNHNDKKTKLIYFKGCVNEVFPTSANALKKIFKNLDIEIIEKDFDCCGLPFLSSGNLERFEEVKKHNLEQLDCEYDYILTDCASCENTLKSYGKLKVINAAEFLTMQNIKFKFKKPLKVTFHKPCHLENINFIKKLFEKCENIEYIEMKDFDACCGFAGTFVVKNPKLSLEISKQKALNIINTKADYVLTACPACILGIKEGFLALGKKNTKLPKISNIIDFLAQADNITQ